MIKLVSSFIMFNASGNKNVSLNIENVSYTTSRIIDANGNTNLGNEQYKEIPLEMLLDISSINNDQVKVISKEILEKYKATLQESQKQLEEKKNEKHTAKKIIEYMPQIMSGVDNDLTSQEKQKIDKEAEKEAKKPSFLSRIAGGAGLGAVLMSGVILLTGPAMMAAFEVGWSAFCGGLAGGIIQNGNENNEFYRRYRQILAQKHRSTLFERLKKLPNLSGFIARLGTTKEREWNNFIKSLEKKEKINQHVTQIENIVKEIKDNTIPNIEKEIYELNKEIQGAFAKSIAEFETSNSNDVHR